MATEGGAVLGVTILALLSVVVAGGDFMVLKSPNYVKFVGASAIETSEIGPMIAASFGLPLDRDLKWNGLEEISLFHRPKATAVISVTSVPAGRLNIKSVASYKTVEVDSDLSSAEQVIQTIENIDWKVDPLTVDVSVDGNLCNVYSSRSEVFANLPLSLSSLKDDVQSSAVEQWFSSSELASLSISNESDWTFISELYLIRRVVNMMVENRVVLKTRSPDFLHFTVTGLKGLADNYGVDSVQFGDALNLLQLVIAQISDQLQSVYGDDLVVELVTYSPDAVSKPKIRRGRNLLETTEAPSATGNLNLAPSFTDSYSAIFNICLWFMIIFSIVVFYIGWAIWFMDPGRDSIIYRMTSTRMKRD